MGLKHPRCPYKHPAGSIPVSDIAAYLLWLVCGVIAVHGETPFLTLLIPEDANTGGTTISLDISPRTLLLWLMGSFGNEFS